MDWISAHWKVDDGTTTNADLNWLVDCAEVTIFNGFDDNLGGLLRGIFGGGVHRGRDPVI